MKTLRKKQKTLLVLSILMIFVVALVFIGIIIVSSSAKGVAEWMSFESSCLGTKPYSSKTIEKMARISLPASTTELKAEASGMQDCDIFLSFNIKPDELTSFLRSTYINSSLSRGPLQSYFNNYIAMSKRALDSQSYLVGDGVQNGEHQYIAVKTDDPLLYTIYFNTFLP